MKIEQRIRNLLAPSLLLIGSVLTINFAFAAEEIAPSTEPAATEKKKEDQKLTKIVKTKKEWRKQLTRQQFYVTREEGTEKAFRNAYWNNKQKGIYKCVCCGLELFASKTKFKSGTGWPSFYEPIDEDHIGTQLDRTLFFGVRTEVHCERCDAHLGHVFDDAPAQPTGLRYCLNSAALKFVKEAKKIPPKKSEPKDAEVAKEPEK